MILSDSIRRKFERKDRYRDFRRSVRILREGIWPHKCARDFSKTNKYYFKTITLYHRHGVFGRFAYAKRQRLIRIEEHHANLKRLKEHRTHSKSKKMLLYLKPYRIFGI